MYDQPTVHQTDVSLMHITILYIKQDVHQKLCTSNQRYFPPEQFHHGVTAAQQSTAAMAAATAAAAAALVEGGHSSHGER